MSRSVRTLSLLGATTLGLTTLLVVPAVAGCHVAGFVEEAVTVDESGESVLNAVLTVELRGRVGSCAGTVDVTTVDGTAVAGEDYESLTTTLTFEVDDDRVETVDLVLLDDDESEGDESFTVELSNPTGGIASTGGPATVRIVDDEGAEDQPGGGDPASDAPATDGATADAVASGVLQLDDEVTEPPSAILVVVIAMAVIGGAAFMGRRGRRG